MSNRRRPRHQRRARAHQTEGPTLEEVMPWIWAMKDVDEAERRGDAAGALEIMRQRPVDRHGRVAWSTARMDRLAQVEVMGSPLPRWAVSRWVLAQAVQVLDDDDPLGQERRRHAAALTSDLCDWGSDGESQIRMMDHDWFYRQILLWEQGALARFVSHVAAPDLLTGADHITDWVAAPMGGFIYRGSRDGVSTWTDLATDELLTLPDIGSGSMLAPDLPVIGRLVPVDGGAMFESAPQQAPVEIARRVAGEPDGWLDAVRMSGNFVDEVESTMVEEFGLVTDVPRVQWSTWLAGWRPRREQAFVADPQLQVRAVLDRAAVELPRSIHRFLPEGEQYDEAEQPGWQPWACLGSALLDPRALPEIASVVTSSDVPVLAQLHDLVAEPARSVIGNVLRHRSGAA